MPQDLIGCWKRRKLKALIPRVVVFVNDPSSAERRIDFAVFLIVLWSYGRKRKYSLISGYGCLCVHMRVCVLFFLLYGSPWTPQAPTVAMQLLTQELGNNRPVIWCKKSALQVNNNLRTSRFEVV